MRVSPRIWAAIACGFVACAALAPANAAGILEKLFYMRGPDFSGQLPVCEDALGTIGYQFALKEGRFWNSGLRILSWDNVREIRNTWAPDTIPRRFCRAVAYISDGKAHAVNYWIGEDTAVIGSGPSVDWCVVGLDRNWAYNPKCKMALP